MIVTECIVFKYLYSSLIEFMPHVIYAPQSRAGRRLCCLLYPTLCLEDLECDVEWLLLGHSWVVRCLLADVHVSPHMPSRWQTECLLQLRIETWEHVHVLQVGTETLKLDGCPNLELEHAAGVVGPLVEHVGCGLVGVLRRLDVLAVVPEGDLKSLLAINVRLLA